MCVTHAYTAPPDLQIGYRHVVDATLQEEACSLASLLVAVTSKGVVTCMRKVGKGSLDPESIFEMMEVRLVLRQVLGPGSVMLWAFSPFTPFTPGLELRE